MDDIMDTVLIGGFLVLWIPLTIWIFIKYKNHITMISFNGAKGFFDGYEGMLIESAVAAAAIILIPFLLLYYVFKVYSALFQNIYGGSSLLI